MKASRIGGIALLALVVGAPLALAGEKSADDLIKEFRGEAEPVERTPQQLEAAYAKVLDDLAPKIQGDDPRPRQGPEQTLEWICWRAGRPGAEAERLAACTAIAKRLGADIPKQARIWLTKQLLHIGRDEAVDALAAQLAHAELRVREWTRRALQNNPSPRAADALRSALLKATEADWKVALINALAWRQDNATVQALIRQARDANDEVRAATCAALGKIGDKAAADALKAAMTRGSDRAKAIATDNYLRLADKLCAKDDKAAALPIYRGLLGAGGHVRCAAIIGLGRAGGVRELPTIFETLADPDPRVRGAGLAALELLPADAVAQAIMAKLKTASPEMKVALLRALARGGDQGVLPVFIAAAGDPNEAVRLEAYAAMGKLRDPKAADVLIPRLLKAQGKELGAIQAAINRIAGRQVTEALVAAMGKADAKARVELIRCIALRKTDPIVEPLLRTAGGDADATVRAEALDALADAADVSAYPVLVRLLVQAREDKDRRAAEKTVTTVARRLDDESQRARPLLTALRGASVPARAALLRVLGRLGGDEALEATRAAVKDPNPDIQDAAIRTLAKWESPAVAPDLIELARNAKSLAHRVIALDGYVRVLGMMSGKPLAELLKRYEAAMAAAPRPEDKKRVLAGMSEVGNLGALRLAQQYLDDPALKAEAEVACVKIARAISGSHQADAKAALEQILKTSANADLKKQAQDGINVLERFEDYIVAWQVSGPHGNRGPRDFDRRFAPEDPKAKDVQWRPMPIGTTKGKPWLVEPDHVGGLKGNNRTAYFRTRLYSPKQQEALMQLGSDDGVKVWIAGKLVHANNATRPCSPGQDKQKVALPEGWSDLKVKLTQGGGEWAFCIRFRAPDGTKLEGVKAQVGGGE